MSRRKLRLTVRPRGRPPVGRIAVVYAAWMVALGLLLESSWASLGVLALSAVAVFWPRSGVHLRDYGLAVALPGRRRWRCRWDEVTEVAREAGVWRIGTLVGTFEIPRDWRNADAAAYAIEKRCGLARPAAEVDELNRDSICAWLGIAPGELLVAAPDRWQGRKLPAMLGLGCLAVCVALAVIAASVPGSALAAPAAAAAVMCGFVGVILSSIGALPAFFDLLDAISGSDSRLVASSSGLESRRARVDWAAVSALEPYEHQLWRLVSDDGEMFVCERWRNSDQILNTVRNLLTARREGQSLPRLDGVSEAAISRAVHIPNSVQTGLSRADTPE